MNEVLEHQMVGQREIPLSRIGAKVLQAGLELVPVAEAVVWSKLQGFDWSEQAHLHLQDRLGWTTRDGIMQILDDNECAVIRKGVWALLKLARDQKDNRFDVREISTVYGLLADSSMDLDDARSAFNHIETVQVIAAALLEDAPITDHNKRLALDAAAKMCRRLSQVSDPKQLGQEDVAMLLKVQSYLTEMKAA